MNDENKELLNEVQKDRLERALNEPDEDGTAFKEAMQVTDRLTELEKHESSIREQLEKQKAEEKQRKKESRRTLIGDCIKLGLIPLGLMTVKFFMGRSNQKLIGMIEQYETPVTTPGKSQHKSMIDDYRL